MTPHLRASYRFCGAIARREARNFYYAFLLLPPAARRSMSALYAFMRQSDDLADNPAPASERRAALAAWRSALERALSAKSDGGWPGFPALVDTLNRYEIPDRYLEDVLDGVSMDVEPARYRSFADLYLYCYRVASAVGLCCLRIWGCQANAGRAEQAAEACGIALQLTNIVRDVRADALAGRIYLPLEDLDRFGVAPEELAAARPPERCRNLLAFQCHRAGWYYARGAPLLGLLRPAGRPAFHTICGIYRALLDEIVEQDYDVFTGRVSVPALRKTAIALKSLRWWFAHVPEAAAAATPAMAVAADLCDPGTLALETPAIPSSENAAHPGGV